MKIQFNYLRTSILYTLIFFSGILAAQTKSLKKSPVLTEGVPLSVGISEERLQKLDQMLADEVNNGNLPGLTALVARNGKIVLWKAYGLANSETGKIMKRDDIFRIASQSKAITSTAVMMLWEEGKFRLDDPISKFIPEFKNPMVLKTFSYSDTSWTGEPAKSEITIRQLLTHTSGIGYGMIDPDERFKMIYDKADVTDIFSTREIYIKDFIKRLGKLPLHHHPGEKFTYAMGLDVLGYLVEICSGMPFDKFLKSRIFDPLGMNDTYFYLPEDKYQRLVSIQIKENDKWKTFTNKSYDPEYPVHGAKTFFAGGSGLCSTVKDYATFLQMYLNGGELNGIRLLSRKTVDVIMANQTGELFGFPDRCHGLAFGVTTQKGEEKGGNGSEGTFDWGGYFNTQYFADPKEKIIGLIFKQTQGPVKDDTSWKFRQMIYQTIDD